MSEDKIGSWQKTIERQIKRPLSDDETAAAVGVMLGSKYPIDRRKHKRNIRIAMTSARRAEISN
jgi:hypothetical protein